MNGSGGIAVSGPVIPLASSVPLAPPVSPRTRTGRWVGGSATQKGGRRVSFTPGPAPLSSRRGAMTPFPVRAAWSCTRKSTREPLFPRRPTSSRVVRRSGRSGAPPTGPGAPGSPAGSLLRSSSWTTCVGGGPRGWGVWWGEPPAGGAGGAPPFFFMPVAPPHASGPSRSAASRHARRRPTMRDDRWCGVPGDRRRGPRDRHLTAEHVT